jgi:Fur family ferric uptake transcriptional regulator
VISAAARLRLAGLRATRQRIAILDTLERLGGHRTTEEIGGAMRRAGTTTPRASLYHALATMAARGVVLVADSGPGTARYELAADWHHHLVCRRCGGIVDVPCLTGSRPCLEASIPGAVVDEAQVVFRGLCPACAARGRLAADDDRAGA